MTFFRGGGFAGARFITLAFLFSGAVTAFAGNTPPLSLFADSDSLSEAPEVADSLRRLEDSQGLALLDAGESLLKEGKLRAAERKYFEVLFSRSPSVVVRARFGLAAVYSRTPRRLFDAVAQYRRILRLEPENRAALRALADTGFRLQETGGFDLAERALRRLVLVDPDYEGAYELWRGKIRDQDPQDLRQVDSHLRDWLPRHPERGYWWLDLAWDSFRLGNLGGVFASLDSLRLRWPGYKRSEQCLLTARCCLELGDTAAFERGYNEALEIAGREGGFERLSFDAQTIMTPAERVRWEGEKSPEQGAALFRQFWMHRDPDPTTPHNERLVEHYVRLAGAEKYYKQLFPHSKFQTSANYQRLTSGQSQTVDYDPVKEIGDLGTALALDQRGLLYMRFGAPEKIDKPEISQAPNPAEVWWYKNSGFFIFERKFGTGDFRFIPSAINGAGSIRKAMAADLFDDPMPSLQQDYYGADFRGLDAEVEVEFYQSVPLAAAAQPPAAVTVLYDSTWTELARDSSVAAPVRTPSDSFWLGINRLSAGPGRYFYVAKLEIPGRRVVAKKELRLATYGESELDISGVVLGSTPQPGDAPLERGGVGLLPRPSLRFARGEPINVYFEVYGLRPGAGGSREFREKVTVVAADKKESGGG
ncbi:GWxTD domain-containing protein, partial [bacterium]|nr:GWxTD domain-containing protein [bacterium]